MSYEPKRDSYMEFLKKAAIADSEADLDGLFALFEPEGKSRVEMGDIYTNALGYNPITHFDVEELSGVMESILAEADPAFISAVKPKRKQIVARAMEIFDVERTETLKRCLAKAGKEILSEELGRILSQTLLGHDLTEESENDFEGLEDDDDIDSLADTMADMEDEASGLSPSELDDELEDFEFEEED